MVTAEQPKFIELVSEVLGSYSKAPTASEIENWWLSCRLFNLSDVERALRDHAFNEEEGKRAPRPIDVKRKLQFGTRESAGCAASGAAGNCAYPGIFADSTTGSSRWWCPWHRAERGGPEAERWIEVSQNVPYATAMKKRSDRMLAEAQRAACVVDTAHAIARRHGNKAWQPDGFTAALPPGPLKPPIVNEDAEDAPAEEIV